MPPLQPSLAKLPAEPTHFTSLLFVLFRYLVGVLPFVLFNTILVYIKENAACIVEIVEVFSTLIG